MVRSINPPKLNKANLKKAAGLLEEQFGHLQEIAEGAGNAFADAVGEVPGLGAAVKGMKAQFGVSNSIGSTMSHIAALNTHFQEAQKANLNELAEAIQYAIHKKAGKAGTLTVMGTVGSAGPGAAIAAQVGNKVFQGIKWAHKKRKGNKGDTRKAYATQLWDWAVATPPKRETPIAKKVVEELMGADRFAELQDPNAMGRAEVADSMKSTA